MVSTISAVSPRLPSKQCFWLNTDSSRPRRMECRPIPFSIPFFQVIDVVMLWPVHVHKVPQASGHLCPAKVQTRCDICCACQSVCQFIPTDSGIHRSLCSRRLCMAVCQSGQPIPDSTFCRRFIESVRMMACVICASR